MAGNDHLRFHKGHAQLHGAFGSDAFGQKAEKVARFFGTAQYLAGQSAFVVAWIAVNAVAVALRWDPYPFILLNLLFSTQAAYAAPLVLLAQTRQADRDKVTEKADAAHREELAQRNEELIRENTLLTTEVRQQTAVLDHMSTEMAIIRQAVAPQAPVAGTTGGTADG